MNDVEIDEDEILRAGVGRLLAGSRYRAPKHWPHVVACVMPEGSRVVPRVSLATELQAAGLAAAGHEVMARKVAAGSVLLYLVRDDACAAEVTFRCVPLTPAAVRAQQGRCAAAD